MPIYQGFNQQQEKKTRTRIRIRLFFSLFILVTLFFLLTICGNDLFSLSSPSHHAGITPSLNSSNGHNQGPPQGKIKDRQTKKTTRKITGSIKSGQSFYSVLSHHGFSPASITRFVEAYKPVFNCRKISPGDAYEIVTDAQDDFINLTIKTSPVDVYQLRREGKQLVASKDEILPDRNITTLSTVIEHSLFGALAKAGERDPLAIAFADIFAWDIDFRHDLRKGDRFKIIFEKYYKDDTFIQYGKILAAEYRSRGKTHRAIYFKDPEGREDYYTPEGNSLRRSFLRTPLRFTRISSGYSYRRFHPILKRYKPHLGVDFAAPTGTPVWAVADGVVIKKGWKNGNGKMVTIRHPNGYETMYNHLSRYGKGIKAGKRVQQKDIIGYVGTTGLSTGPHLDYRMKKNGAFVNPLKEKFPPGFPVNKAYRNKFFEFSQQMMVLLDKEDFPSTKVATLF